MSELPRRRKRIIAAVVVAAALVGGWWWWRRAPEGFIVDVRAIEDGSAVVLWRYNPKNGPSREWIARFDAGGELDWRRELPGLTSSSAMLVIGDLVSVRYAREKARGTIEQVVAGYALAGGDRVWERALMASPGDSDFDVVLPFLQAFAAGGKLIEQVVERGEHLTHVVHVIDPASGQDLGHAPIGGQEAVGPLVVGDRLILHQNHDEVQVVDPSHGAAVTALRVGGGGIRSGCIIGDDYVNVVLEGHELALVAFHHGDPASRRVLAQPFRPVPDLFNVRSCGRYKDRIVFVLVESPPRTPRSKTSIAITDLDGALVATIAMPFSAAFSFGTLTMPPDSLPFSGALPRFVPYLSTDDTKQDDAHQYLAMVDLEQARIAWVAAQPRALSDGIFRAADRWYLNNTITGGDLVAFDGATGQLVAAIHGGKALEPAHVAGGKLWLHHRGWGRLDAAPLAVLDAKTLAPRFARDIDISEVTSAARATLGIP